MGPGHPPKWVDRILAAHGPSHDMVEMADPLTEALDDTDYSGDSDNMSL